MSQSLLPCPFCDEEAVQLEKVGPAWIVQCSKCYGGFVGNLTASKARRKWNTRPSSWVRPGQFANTRPLDRLLDSRFDMAAEAEADLGEIEHKGEKVMVKIKVVRGERWT